MFNKYSSVSCTLFKLLILGNKLAWCPLQLHEVPLPLWPWAFKTQSATWPNKAKKWARNTDYQKIFKAGAATLTNTNLAKYLTRIRDTEESKQVQYQRSNHPSVLRNCRWRRGSVLFSRTWATTWAERCHEWTTQRPPRAEFSALKL